jgi:hypothetical protein
MTGFRDLGNPVNGDDAEDLAAEAGYNACAGRFG